MKRLIGSAIVLVAALLLCGPAENLLDQLTTAFDWTVPFQLVAMIAGLILVSAVGGIFLQRLTPKSSRYREDGTLMPSYSTRFTWDGSREADKFLQHDLLYHQFRAPFVRSN